MNYQPYPTRTNQTHALLKVSLWDICESSDLTTWSQYKYSDEQRRHSSFSLIK